MNESPVLILSPMTCECEYLLSLLKDKKETHIAGYAFYEGTLNGVPTVIARCLIGNVNAAVCTTLSIKKYSPKCIILQGTAGAHSPRLSRNDIVIAEKIVPIANYASPHRAAGEGSDPFSWGDFDIQVYSAKSGKTNFVYSLSCDERLIELALSVEYSIGKTVVGTVGCGDVWNKEADLIIHHHNTKGTDCEAMEGIGAAQVCEAFGIPMIEIRVISNNELKENETFSKETALNCQKFVFDYIEKLKIF